MPMNQPAYASVHTAKIIRQPPSANTPSKHIASKSKSAAGKTPNRQQVGIQQPPPTLPSLKLSSAQASNDEMSISDEALTASRTTSLAGRKRPRESDGDLKLKARRTKSMGEPRDRKGLDAAKAKDREAFQRGLIAVFVPNALRESARGNTQHYTELLAHFLPTPLAPVPALPPLLTLLRAITANVSLVSQDLHTALVKAILALPWATGEERFVKTYIGFCGVLCSAQPIWTKDVVSMAIQGLAWQSPSSGSSDVLRATYFKRHHRLIAHLLSLIPTLPNVLGPLVVRHFPHKREREVSQTTWIRNMCKLLEYCPELQYRVWGEIVDRMLRIDAEITQRAEDDDDDDDDEEEEEDEEEEADAFTAKRNPSSLDPAADPNDPFQLFINQDVPIDPALVLPVSEQDDGNDSDPDPDDLSSDDGDGSDDEDGEAMSAVKEVIMRQKKRIALKSMRAKLDGMMVYFIDHLRFWLGDPDAQRPATSPVTSYFSDQAIASSGMVSGRSTPTSGQSTPTVATPAVVSPKRLSPDPVTCVAHFQSLLNLFTRKILPTSSTQHVPFLLFLTSSFSPAHTDLFLGVLVSQALYGTTTTAPSLAAQPISIPQRVAAAVYIGSIVCRARFVTDEQARQVMSYLLAYIDGKLHQSRVSQSVDELPLFYAVSQAVMLIFCFRWRACLATAARSGRHDNDHDNDGDDELLGELELEDEGMNGAASSGDGKWMADLDVLQRAITSDLNPLLGCNPTIVQTFAKVAHHTNFAYCFSIIESNAAAARSASMQSIPRSMSGSLAQSATAGSGSSSFTGGKAALRPGSASTAAAAAGAVGSVHASSFSRHQSAPALSFASRSAITIPRHARQSNIDAGLDSYFPFDPYDLSRSGRYIEKHYRVWSDVAIDDDDDDDDDEDDDEESDDSGAEEEESQIAIDVDDDDDDDDLNGQEDSSPESSLEKGGSLHARFAQPAYRTLPKAVKAQPGSFDRRKYLKDNGLSTSLEGMSISPNISCSRAG